MTRLTDPQTVTLRQQRLALSGLKTGMAGKEMPELPRTARRLPRVRKAWLVVIVGVAALAGGLYWRSHRPARHDAEVRIYDVKPMTLPVTLTARGEVKAKKNTEIRCEVEGRSTIVWLIEEGKQVKEGDVLVELTNDGGGGALSLSIDDRIKQQEIVVANAKAALEAAQKNHEIQLDLNASNIRKGILARDLARLDLTKFNEGDYPQLKQTARLLREESEAILRRATSTYETSKQLYARGYITKTEHETDQFNAYKAGLEVEKAKLAEEILDKYGHHRDLELKKSAVEEAEKELDRTKKSAEAQAAQSKAALEAQQSGYEIQTSNLAKLRRQKEHLKINAPGPGMVVYHRSNPWDPQRIEVGASVYERQILIDLPDPSVMLVEVKVNESQMDKVDLDLPASIEVEGIPNVRFTGRVTKIGVLADAQNRWLNPNLKEYTNEITLDQHNDEFKPGMSADCEILVKRLEGVLAVPVQGIFTKEGHSYVFVTNGETRVQEVKLGIASTEYAQIVEGLKPGQKVLLAINDELKRMLPSDEGSDLGTRSGKDKAWPGPAAPKQKGATKGAPASRPAKPPTTASAAPAGNRGQVGPKPVMSPKQLMKGKGSF